MASGMGGSWSHPAAQTAAPMVKAESGSGACLYLDDLVGRRGSGAELGTYSWRFETLEGVVKREIPAGKKET